MSHCPACHMVWFSKEDPDCFGCGKPGVKGYDPSVRPPSRYAFLGEANYSPAELDDRDQPWP